MVVAFCCESEAMHRLEKKVLLLHQREKQCLKPLMDEAQQAYQYFENDPALVNLRKKPTAPWGSDQLIQALSGAAVHLHLPPRRQCPLFPARHHIHAVSPASAAGAAGARLSCRALFRGHHASIAGRGARHKRLTAQARVPRADRPEHGALSHGAAHRRGKASDPRGKPSRSHRSPSASALRASTISPIFLKQTGMSPTEYEKNTQGIKEHLKCEAMF